MHSSTLCLVTCCLLAAVSGRHDVRTKKSVLENLLKKSTNLKRHIPGPPGAPLDPAYISAIRLMGGDDSHEGRVEVKISGEWAAVCDDQWGNRDANVVCSQLFGINDNSAIALSRAHERYGTPLDVVGMNNVACQGDEDTLRDCPHTDSTSQDCNPLYESAGVVCHHGNDLVLPPIPAPVVPPVQPPVLPPVLPIYPPITAQFDVYLSYGFTDGEGVVLMAVEGRWMYLCAEFFTHNDAQVVCSQLGYATGMAIDSNRYTFSSTYKIWTGDLFCAGNEDAIAQCMHYDHGFEYCDSKTKAAVMCSTVLVPGNQPNRPSPPTVPVPPPVPAPPPTSGPQYPAPGSISGKISLVGRMGGDGRMQEGMLYVYNAGQWGTVCGLMFNDADATVACRDLGFRMGFVIYHGTQYYPEGTGMIWLTDINCHGTEETLWDCPHGGFGNTAGCTHNDDVAISCMH